MTPADPLADLLTAHRGLPAFTVDGPIRLSGAYVCAAGDWHGVFADHSSHLAAVVRASGTTTPRGSCPEHGLTYCAECGWVLPGETTRELAALRAELEAIRTTIQPMTTVAAAWLDTRLNDALNGPR